MIEGDNSDTEQGMAGAEEAETVTKSVSSSHLDAAAGVPDSGLGSSYKELSRSLDFLGVVSAGDPGDDPSPGCDQGQRRKSQTLPPLASEPSPVLIPRDRLKHMSLGTAFGSKKLGLSRKLTSIITVPTERYGRSRIVNFCYFSLC